MKYANVFYQKDNIGIHASLKINYNHTTFYLIIFEGQHANERCTSNHQCKQSLSCEQNTCKCVVNKYWNGSLCEPSMCYADYIFTNAYVLIFKRVTDSIFFGFFLLISRYSGIF